MRHMMLMCSIKTLKPSMVSLPPFATCSCLILEIQLSHSMGVTRQIATLALPGNCWKKELLSVHLGIQLPLAALAAQTT
nr:MAG TPA: hypothetical protein [Caudoviricetes sp.]